MDTLNLPGTASCTVAIHPVVLFTITDAFVRRDEGKPRVIGTLLGNTNADGVVEIHDCYAGTFKVNWWYRDHIVCELVDA